MKWPHLITSSPVLPDTTVRHTSGAWGIPGGRPSAIPDPSATHFPTLPSPRFPTALGPVSPSPPHPLRPFPPSHRSGQVGLRSPPSITHCTLVFLMASGAFLSTVQTTLWKQNEVVCSRAACQPLGSSHHFCMTTRIMDTLKMAAVFGRLLHGPGTNHSILLP